jgi:hypothetical protein
MAKKTSPADRKQIEAFRKAARELGCDENEERFRQVLRTISGHKPKRVKRTPLTTGKRG